MAPKDFKEKAKMRKAENEERDAKKRQAQDEDDALEAQAAEARQRAERRFVLDGSLIHGAEDFHKALYAQGLGETWKGIDEGGLWKLLDACGPYTLEFKNTPKLWERVPGGLMAALQEHGNWGGTVSLSSAAPAADEAPEAQQPRQFVIGMPMGISGFMDY